MSVQVTSSRGSYPVEVHAGASAMLGELVASSAQVAVVTSTSLRPMAERVAAGLPVTWIEVPDAEAAKTPETLIEAWNQLAAAGFTRSDAVVGIGGGTVTDLAGFIAASWLRGVPYVGVPTTVLAMVDAAVGGKTGINLAAGKNLVGAFYEPRAVLCDLALLETLPAVEVRAGLAEVIKCGFIADARILELAQNSLSELLDVTSATFQEAATRAIQVKADVVGADLTERTSEGTKVGREALNYGHTLGHAIEAYHGYQLRHGEAISIGMAWIARVSQELLGLSTELVELHDELLAGVGLPLGHDPSVWPELRESMSLDKKARGTTLRLIGLRAQGAPEVLAAPDEQVLESAYRRLPAAVI